MFNQQILQKYLPQLMLQQMMCAVIEKVINSALTLNANTNVDKQLYLLEQKTLVIKLAELPFPLCFSINNSTVLVTKLLDRANCTITTSIKTLKTLKQEQQITLLIKQDKLDVDGDIKVAQQFAHIAENLEIDWQSELAKHIGDVPTHKLNTFAKNLSEKIGFAAEQIQADASEYIIHEKKLVVTNSEIQTFNLKVQHLADNVDDLSSRLAVITENLMMSQLSNK